MTFVWFNFCVVLKMYSIHVSFSISHHIKPSQFTRYFTQHAYYYPCMQTHYTTIAGVLLFEAKRDVMLCPSLLPSPLVFKLPRPSSVFYRFYWRWGDFIPFLLCRRGRQGHPRRHLLPLLWLLDSVSFGGGHLWRSRQVRKVSHSGNGGCEDNERQQLGSWCTERGGHPSTTASFRLRQIQLHQIHGLFYRRRARLSWVWNAGHESVGVLGKDTFTLSLCKRNPPNPSPGMYSERFMSKANRRWTHSTTEHSPSPVTVAVPGKLSILAWCSLQWRWQNYKKFLVMFLINGTLSVVSWAKVAFSFQPATINFVG